MPASFSQVVRGRKAVVAVMLETTPGTLVTPLASGAVHVEKPTLSWNPTVVKSDETSPSLTMATPVIGGVKAELTFSVLLKGNGTAGTLPQWDLLMKACSVTPTIMATALPAAPEALAAGGTTTTATLGTTAAASLQAYRGMPINFTGAVTGTSFVSDYTAAKLATLTDTFGGALIATTNYQVPACVVYTPSSVTPCPSVSMGYWLDGTLYQIAGARGTMTLSMESSGIARLNFKFSGMFVSETEASLPAPSYDVGQAPVLRAAVISAARLPLAFKSWSLDLGNSLAYIDNPNTSQGFDPPEITARETGVKLVTKKYLPSTGWDALGQMLANGFNIFHARWGTAAGNRVAVTIPTGLIKDYKHTDNANVVNNDLDVDCAGLDAEFCLTLY